jgi:hypothetical protein
MLTDSARTDPAQAIFQLAHEVVHLLAPTGRYETVVFEEGLATLFSNEMAEKHGSLMRADRPDYLDAADLVRRFLTQYPDGVRAIRAQQPSFNKFTLDIVCRICPEIPKWLAEAMCLPFRASQ